MKKSIILALFSLLVAGSLHAAYQVKDEAELKRAISDGQTDILLTGSFTTTGNINIPAGCTVTLGEGVVLTVYYKPATKYSSAQIHYIKGEGTIVEGVKYIETEKTRTLPTIGGTNNPFSGMKYDVTRNKVKVNGSLISKADVTQVQCKVKSSVSVDGGKTVHPVDFHAKAAVCTVSLGINGGRTLVKAYPSMREAYNAAKYTSYSDLTYLHPDKKIVVLFDCGEVDLPVDNPNVGVIIDSAGLEVAFPDSPSENEQFNSSSAVTFLNASSAKVPKITESSLSFINCSSVAVNEVNANKDSYKSQVHIYDCGSGTLDLGSKYPKSGGAYFHCGGPYTMSFGSNYKVYGGIFVRDPRSYLSSTDLEAVQDSDGNWVVQEKKKTVNVAFIGSTGYESLQGAVNAANEGDKIELVSDVELEGPVVVAAGKNITVELAGMDIVSQSGAFINNGMLKLEDSSNYDEPSRLTAATGNLIENNGSLEITYGDYSGAILLNGGTFTVHGGTFNGTLVAGADVVSPKSVADIRGGKFKNSVAAFLAEGYLEPKHHDGYCYVGKFPYSVVADKAISGTEKGWTLKGLSDEDRAIYSKTSNQRADYSDADWYRRAELISMLTPYSGYTIDCVVSFDRATAKESVQIYLQTVMSITEKQDKDLQANEIYRILSSKIEEGNSQISYERFLKEDAYKSIAVGIKNLSEENDGTVCTIEFHLCKPDTHNKTELVTVYVLASESYQFPVKTVEIALPKIENATWWYNGEEVTGSIVVDKGTNVELTLKAADGYQFAGGATSMAVKFDNLSENITVDNSAFSGVAAPNFTVAKIGSLGYTSLAAAISAANSGDTITLVSDVTLTETLKINSDKVVTLDLNGYVVDGREKVRIAIMSYGDLTIKDSSDAKLGAVKAGTGTAGNTVNICGGSFVLESGNIYSLNNAILVDEESASVEIKGGTITAEPNTRNSAAMYISSTSDTEVKITGGSLIGYNGILLWNNTSIEMTSGSIVAQGGVGIQGNGSKDNTEIAISGEAVISGYYAAIYHPQGGKLSISGGLLSGWTGVVVKGGNVTISGGSISGTGTANAYAPVNSGYVDTGDALYVEHYDNSANSENYGTPVVTVTGGTFTSVHANAIGNYANPNNVADGVTKLTKYVSGGTFSDPVEADCCADGFASVKVGDKYSVGALPDADVTNLGAITVGKGDYTADAYLTYNLINGGKLEEASVPYNLTLAMDFKAKDTAGEAAEGMFGSYITDFFIKMDGMSSASFVGDGCYLAGYYASYGMWVKIPLDGFTVENGKTYPVITSAGQFFTYADICGTVGEFICGIYLTPEVLAANPNLTVELTLGLSENNAAALNADFTKVDSYLYTSDELMPSDLPEVEITDIKDSLTENDPDLTFALNFKIKDLENLPAEYLDKLIERYGDYYTDYVLTISGLTDPNASVTFNADGTGDGYLAGQYDAWNANWVAVPFEDVTIKNGESLYIMECAGRITGQSGLRVTLREVAQIIKDFDCGVYFTPEFLAANPNLEVKLELKVFTEDEEGNKTDDISVATNMFDKDGFSVKAAKLYIRIVNGKPQIGYEGEGTLVLNAAANLTGEWTKKIPYTIVENDGDDTKTWVTPAEGYYFFKGFIVK